MKIIVLNFARYRVARPIVAILLVTVILVATCISVVTTIYGREIWIEAADAIPYEKIIILDAGHGGEDPGAIGVSGCYEKDLNLEFALTIGTLLEEKDYIVLYTRTDDRLLYNEDENIKGIRKISDLKNRCKYAEKYPESIFVSIHMNSFGDGKYSGLQVYYSDKNESSKILADNIQNSVRTNLQQNNNRKTKESSSIYVLDNIPNCGVLIECGFLTNSEECEKLSQKEYQKQLSFAIVCGIIEYIEKSNI